MKEIIENALSEIEDAIVNAMNSCKDEYEILALAVGIASEWNALVDRATERWTPKTETEAKHGEISF